ncbi:Uncharacterised protein [Sebaldella termitidis]|uniref:Plasmid stabilization system n=1 Tax=Sebaldella termitidis (strain ATCC 33386 / NCTC 11300) TaxID=526218 RepID=D1AS09_SEBTE|nr:hypothetical protein [Sebaldella termitidis]ACZ10996.1 conserved hypothetical protein [Sebaldella termitidis ATCC 33386]MBP9596667.1 hypothetical protein [Fusobacteriaceae bacterium]SUI81156.1 Uncharacterised protein [Sebaldella termitidis]
MKKSYKVIYSKQVKGIFSEEKFLALNFFKAFDEITKDFTNISYHNIKYIRDNYYVLKINNYNALFQVLKNKNLVFVIGLKESKN